MTQIFAITAGNAAAQGNLRKSLANPLPLEKFVGYFPRAQQDEIRKIAEAQGGLYAWAAIPGEKNTGRWERMTEGDWVVCIVSSRYRYVSRLLKKYDNKEFSRAVWGKDPTGNDWNLMYFLERPIPVDIAVESLSEWLPEFYGGFTRIGDESLEEIEAEFGSVDSFVQSKLINGQGRVEVLPGAFEGAVPDAITREHVLQAMKDWEGGQTYGFSDSVDYDLLHESKRYPPKAMIGIAARYAIGRSLKPSEFSSGEGSACFRKLESLGFKIVAKEPADQVQEPDDRQGDVDAVVTPIAPYDIDDILKDGCFLDREELERILDRLRARKNLILQGPPGTGKTWLARRLAFALIGQKNEGKVRAVQFHPNLSYEDFVRGWRPTGDRGLSLVEGVFMEAIKAAAQDPSSKLVVVIEEINRGNPAQIFGELLTLLEAGKRTPNEAIELCYPDSDGKRRPVHIPENLYVIGTMNIADRSLALVDLALRRRFAFIDLEPRLGPVWRKWVVQERNLEADVVADIERRITELNEQISTDARLGKPFRIGHSYVTPSYTLEDGDTRKWFTHVVETEIGPLLEEYWFDVPDEAKKACDRLLQGW